MAFIKLCSASKSAKVEEVLGKRCHLGVECVCVDCRLLFSKCISTVNLQKKCCSLKRRAALSKAAHLVFEIHEQTRQQKLRDIFFPLSEISTCKYLRVCTL